MFDTAFFHDLPAASATYAIDRNLADRYQIRRYGFHGTSHQYVSARAAEFLGVPLESLNQIVLHLGNGASASAIAGAARRHLDGTDPDGGPGDGHRSGDIDPGIISYLSRVADMDVDAIETMLNRRSGMLGRAARSTSGCCTSASNPATRQPDWPTRCTSTGCAIYIGAYLAVLGHTDVITFTAGVGEHDDRVRRDALSGLAPLGIELDEHLNDSPATGARRISADRSPTTVLVIPTNEELAIARACLTVV